MIRCFSGCFLTVLSQIHYNGIDNSELEGRSNERISYEFCAKSVRDRYTQVAAIVIVISEGSDHI